MKKPILVTLGVLTGLTIGFNNSNIIANAAPTAGYINKKLDTGYTNPTQYIFENNDVWTALYDDEETIVMIDEPIEQTSVWCLNESEKNLLKQTVMAECGYNQPDKGVRMVVDVILNRITSATFPNNIYSVITQTNQFETWSNGAIGRQYNITEQVDTIVEQELKNGVSYPNLLYFTAGSYNPYCTPWAKVGDHYFGY